MMPGPTELIGSLKDLALGEVSSNPQLDERGDKYYHPMLEKWLPFPVEVPSEEEIPETKGKKQGVRRALGKAKDVLRKVGGRKGDLPDEEEDRPTISAPTNFKKLN
jgi:hypothetical protein